MKLFYIITKYILFPGSYLRGLWEHIACKILRIPVEPVGYMRIDEACGHAEHSLAKTPFSSFFLVFFPGFMNFNMGMPLWLAGIMGIFYMGTTIYDNAVLFIFYLVCLYMGMSLLCALFPLSEDIYTFFELVYNGESFRAASAGGKVLKALVIILTFPMALLTRAGAFLEKHGVNFILGIAVIIVYSVFVL